jgi:hypothetical protein
VFYKKKLKDYRTVHYWPRRSLLEPKHAVILPHCLITPGYDVSVISIIHQSHVDNNDLLWQTKSLPGAAEKWGSPKTQVTSHIISNMYNAYIK